MDGDSACVETKWGISSTSSDPVVMRSSPVYSQRLQPRTRNAESHLNQVIRALGLHAPSALVETTWHMGQSLIALHHKTGHWASAMLDMTEQQPIIFLSQRHSLSDGILLVIACAKESALLHMREH